MKLSIIVPAHNEAENIADLIKHIEETVAVEHELLIVNDHSQDNTAAIVEGICADYPNIRLIENKKDKGFGHALSTGFAESRGDVLMPVMGDLCDDLSSIKAMLDFLQQGYDVVCGSRYCKGGARLGGSRLKAFLSRLGGVSLHFLLGIPTRDIPNAFKMYRRKILEGMEIKCGGFAISMEIPLKAYYQGFRITEVPTVWRERTRGRSSFKVFRLLPDYLRLYLWAVLMRVKTLL